MTPQPDMRYIMNLEKAKAELASLWEQIDRLPENLPGEFRRALLMDQALRYEQIIAEEEATRAASSYA